MNVETLIVLLLLSLAANAALSIWLVGLVRRHRACRSTLYRVAGQRDQARFDLMSLEARSRGVGGLPGPHPTIRRLTA